MITVVVPHAGTWIEICLSAVYLSPGFVVPHAGTWIEIATCCIEPDLTWSFPTRERGLKYL